jgi:hypothetical protein
VNQFGPLLTGSTPELGEMHHVGKARAVTVSTPHSFRKTRLRYSSHTGMKQTAVKLTE